VENEIISGSTVGLISVDLVDSCGFLWILVDSYRFLWILWITVDSCGLNRLFVLKDQMKVNTPIRSFPMIEQTSHSILHRGMPQEELVASSV
jgi:hypothetical protein